MENSFISSNQLLQQLNWRYATKKFDPSRIIPEALWMSLEDSLVLTPSSFGLQPWQFFVVRNPDLRKRLVEYSWNQAQVAEASHLLVFAIKKEINVDYVDRYLERMTTVQQVPIESVQGFVKMLKGFAENPPLDLAEWAVRQVYIALGQFMTAAALLGIDTCPMEGFVPSKYDELLGLHEQGFASVVLCPAGYRSSEDKYATRPKVRFEKSAMVQYID